MKTKKGFTLTELVIVLAVMGILAAVLVPSWNYLISKNEINKNNDYSRIVFNAAQTEATKAKFRERKDVTTYQTSTNATEKANALKNIYFGGHASGDFYFYWDGKEGYACDAAGNKLDDANAALDANFAKAINRVFEYSDKVEYKIFISDYTVQSVCCLGYRANCIGSYPTTQDKKSDTNDIVGYDMSTIVLD